MTPACSSATAAAASTWCWRTRTRTTTCPQSRGERTTKPLHQRATILNANSKGPTHRGGSKSSRSRSSDSVGSSAPTRGPSPTLPRALRGRTATSSRGKERPGMSVSLNFYFLSDVKSDPLDPGPSSRKTCSSRAWSWSTRRERRVVFT